MNVLIHHAVKVARLHKALRSGGFILEPLPGNKFLLREARASGPICEFGTCTEVAAVRDDHTSLCARHWASVRAED